MSRRKMIESEKKSNLTININENLLNIIDNIIENKKDKRSRFIEKLLKNYIIENKNKLNENL
jgi:metal-responsive CopG/Arc/MetJ family transcriptional regulator